MSSLKKFRRKIKQSVRGFIFLLTDFSLAKITSIEDKTLVIVKSDLIGDYILFRNFLPYIKQSPKYKDYKIILIGNIAWKNIAETLDGAYYDEMIWVSFNKLYSNLSYRAKTIKSILSRNYQTLFYPVYSGDPYTEEFFIRKIVAKEKITFSPPVKSNNEPTNPFDITIRSSQDNLFEIYRYKEMFESFLDISIANFEWRNLLVHANPIKDIPQEPYIVFFPGSSAYLKRWGTSNFIAVANYLLTRYPYHFVLAGSKKDSKYANDIISGVDEKYKKRFLDLTGKTSLLELAQIINLSNLLVTNDSASLHMAASVNKETVCMFMGENYGRFTPYPKEIFDKGKFICPPDVEKIVQDQLYNPVFLSLNYNPDINSIAPQKVIDAIEELLSQKQNISTTIL